MVEVSKLQIQKYKAQIKNLNDEKSSLRRENFHLNDKNEILRKSIETINLALRKD